MVLVCCVCQRIQREGGWVEEPLPQDELASHGYCPDCAAVARVELELMRYRETCEQSVANYSENVA